MAEYQEVFKRVEKKYLLNETQYQIISEGLSSYMKPDEYSQNTICSLYYDTPDYQLIRTSLEKPVYKEKLRVRSYGIPKDDGQVFVELKKKFNGTVFKRREAMTLAEAKAFLAGGQFPEGKNQQILQEISYFMQYYNDLQPRVLLAYERESLQGTETPDLRLTFDRNIRWRQSALDLGKGDWGSLLLPQGEILMELKLPGVMPLWMADLLDKAEAYHTSFSKYGTCYSNHLIHQFDITGGTICA